MLGLPYPGGAPMDKLAQKSKGGVYTLPVAHVEGAPLDMSFSGLKTAVVNLAHHAEQVGQPLDAPALARDFAQAVSDTLVPRAMEAAKQAGRTVIAAAGGVAAILSFGAIWSGPARRRAITCICRRCGGAATTVP